MTMPESRIAQTRCFLRGTAQIWVTRSRADGNNRDIPCDGCEFADRCAAGNLECSAFRTWAHRGDYKDADVARLMREGK